MKFLDLPIDQIEWFLSEFNEIKRKAQKKEYLETVVLLNSGKLIENLLKEETI